MNLLFVCTENRLRSPTAEAVFGEYDGITAIGCGTNRDAATPLSGDLIEWADLVLVMQKTHRAKVTAKYGELLKDKRLVCLGINDNYDFMDPELVRILKSRVGNIVDI